MSNQSPAAVQVSRSQKVSLKTPHRLQCLHSSLQQTIHLPSQPAAWRIGNRVLHFSRCASALSPFFVTEGQASALLLKQCGATTAVAVLAVLALSHAEVPHLSMRDLVPPLCVITPKVAVAVLLLSGRMEAQRGQQQPRCTVQASQLKRCRRRQSSMTQVSCALRARLCRTAQTAATQNCPSRRCSASLLRCMLCSRFCRTVVMAGMPRRRCRRCLSTHLCRMLHSRLCRTATVAAQRCHMLCSRLINTAHAAAMPHCRHTQRSTSPLCRTLRSHLCNMAPLAVTLRAWRMLWQRCHRLGHKRLVGATLHRWSRRCTSTQLCCAVHSPPCRSWTFCSCCSCLGRTQGSSPWGRGFKSRHCRWGQGPGPPRVHSPVCRQVHNPGFKRVSAQCLQKHSKRRRSLPHAALTRRWTQALRRSQQAL